MGDVCWYISILCASLGNDDWNLEVKCVGRLVSESPAQFEILDMVKKYLFYGKPIEAAKINGELNYLMGNVEQDLKKRGFTLAQCWERNIEKLKARYKGKEFDPFNAINRDLETERKVLEG